MNKTCATPMAVFSLCFPLKQSFHSVSGLNVCLNRDLPSHADGLCFSARLFPRIITTALKPQVLQCLWTSLVLDFNFFKCLIFNLSQLT